MLHNRTPDGKLTPEAIAVHKASLNQMHQFYGVMTNDNASGFSYYTSTNETDFAMIESIVNPPAVSNALNELNAIYATNKWYSERPDISFARDYTAWRNVRRLQNELYGLDAIPIFANRKWVNGAVLATNKFIVSEQVRMELMALNWFESDENFNHIQYDFKNATRIERKITDVRSSIYIYGYRVKFDRRFNLWHLTEKIALKTTKPNKTRRNNSDEINLHYQTGLYCASSVPTTGTASNPDIGEYFDIRE